MNKAITDGITFQPISFEFGLDNWSSTNGRPGSPTYDAVSTAAYVPADQDFGGAMELLKTSLTQKIRYTGETPIFPGCYLRVSAKVKAISGPLPIVQIAGEAYTANGSGIGSLTSVGAATQLTAYGDVVEVSAIVGSGARASVDLVWGLQPVFGHFGLTFTGPQGGVVRIDDIQIEDITTAYGTDPNTTVDVRDYGAIPGGTIDASDAFEAADAAANGRTVVVPEGVFLLNDNVTIENHIQFVGTVTMPVNRRLTLANEFHLPAYIDAFGDEVEGFKRAFQALMRYAGHEGLDMRGRRVNLDGPIDMQAAVATTTTSAVRRVIRNGEFLAQPSSAWDPDVVTGAGTYSTSNPERLTNVTNSANIQIGSLVTGVGVGREIYVKDVDISNDVVTLTQPLYGAAGRQNYTFTRYKYMLDFSGFTQLSLMVLSDIELRGNGDASCVMLAQSGSSFHMRDCFINKPKHRGITSPGSGCQGMMIDRCQFLSNESSLTVQQRVSIGFNANANDVKIRDNRAVHLRHFGILGGSGAVISGNHWFHGDTTVDGVRKGGIIFATANVKSFVTGNYIDNNFLEWTNEYEAEPEFSNQFTFGGLTVTGNVFTCNDVAPWFNFIVIKPYGPGHYIQGLTVTSNVFRALNGNINRVDGVDTTFASLNYGRMKNILVSGNTFNSVSQVIQNPVSLIHTQSSDQTYWDVDMGAYLPFDGQTREVTAVVANEPVRSGSATVWNMPYTSVGQGSNRDKVRLHWPSACRGKVTVTARMDRSA